MVPSANDKLASERQHCLDALAQHAAMEAVANALGLFDNVPANHAAWAHTVLAQLNDGQNATAHNTLTTRLNANQKVTVDWRVSTSVDVVVENDADGNPVVVFLSGDGH
jgi:hypothetical protein